MKNGSSGGASSSRGTRSAQRDELLVRLVSSWGPTSPTKIARRLGVSEEEVLERYRRLKGEGIGPRVSLRMEKLGLRRFAAVAKFGPTAGGDGTTKLLDLMGDYGYLEHWQRLDPADAFLLIYSVPPDLSMSLEAFLAELKETGVMVECVPAPLHWMRYHTIRGPWRGGRKIKAATSGPLTTLPEGRFGTLPSKPDYREVLVLSALQADPDADLDGLVTIMRGWAEGGCDEARALLSRRGIDWGFVLRRALRYVDSFAVHLSRGDPDATRRRRHGWASFTVWWERLDRSELERSAMAATSVPYLRTDGGSVASGLYFAVFSAPSHLIPDYLDFMSENAADRMNVAFPSAFANYSLPFLSFSPEQGGWTWRKERLQSLLVGLQAR